MEGNPGNRDEDDFHPRQDVSEPGLLQSRLTNKDERAAWNHLVTCMPSWWFTEADRHALVAYCQAYGRMRQARRILLKEAMVISRANGSKCVNPILTVLTEAENSIMKWRDELGISRAKRMAVLPDDPERIPNQLDSGDGHSDGDGPDEFGSLIKRPRLAHSA